MLCEDCGARWVALCDGSTIGGGRVSYHFDSEALTCPRPHCGSQGIVNGDLLMEYQRHPDVVATRLG